VRIRKAPALLVGAGVGLVCAVNVVAALSPVAEPNGRLPLVDPFVAAAAATLPPDDSGSAQWVAWWVAAQTAAPAAPVVQAADDEVAPTGVDPAGTEASAAGAQPGTTTSQPGTASSSSDPATPAGNEVAQPAPTQLPRTLDQWVTSVASATGIPARAVEAYGNATLEITAEDPSCRVGWPTLAAIGVIESGHGTHGRTALGDDGRPAVPIVGPALDGSPGRAAIHATADSTAWHGDPVWDHAVGPMQFIPSTWRRWAADGDGDGVADPQDIDDAALATARYLCAGSRDLSTWDGWHAAVLSYNHSEEYVQKVFGYASGYAAAVTG
jgi:membrane-bound lytic murein transglycosylase B